MIRVCTFDSPWTPQTRDLTTVEHRPELTLRDIGDEVLGPVEMAAWVDGEIEKDLTRHVSDGEFVHLMAVPTGILESLLWGLFKFVVAGLIYGAILKHFFPEDAEPAESEEITPYHGFRNNYRPEGEAIPVVYGRIRTSPPIINQSVLGVLPTNQSWIIGHNENLNTMMAVSHGPIAGFGTALSPIMNELDFITRFNNDRWHSANIEINGIASSHFTMQSAWRTGGGGQSPIVGYLGHTVYTNPGVSYTLNFTFPNGTFDEPDPGAPGPSYGQVTYSARIRADDPKEYVRLQLTTQADRAIVQVLFPRGLYEYESSSGNYLKNSRWIQIQYWVTDATGAAVPAHVMILPGVHIESDEAGMFSVDIPIDFTDQETVTGTGGSKGYIVASNDSKRITMTGTGAGVVGSGTDLDRLVCGTRSTRELWTTPTPAGVAYASFDPNLKFSFATWVKVEDWSGGFNAITDGPIQWLAHWSRENTAGDSWPMTDSSGVSTSSPNESNLYLVPHPLNSGTAAESFGWAICLCVDPLSMSPGNGGVSSDDPHVIMKLYSWAGEMGVNDASHPSEVGYMSCWLSKTLGRASQFADWRHVGLVYDQTTFEYATGSGGAPATVRAYVNGLPVDMELQPNTGPVGTNGFSGPFGYGLGWVHGTKWTGTPANSPMPAASHVPVSFFADVKTVFRIGGWDNVTATSPSYNKTSVSLAEYLLYDGDIEEDRPGFYNDQIHSYDDFGNSPVASVQTLMSIAETQDGVRICCPFDDQEVVASNFYQNYKYPLAVDEAGGALRRENVASTIGSGSAVFYPMEGQSILNYYMMEIFCSSPTDSESELVNDCQLDSVTTFQNDYYAYPGVAVLSTSIQANDQVQNSRPVISIEVMGRLVDIWDGESMDSPTFFNEWSDNPAWVALDLLTSQSFGLGQVFAPDGKYDHFDLPQFFEWAAYCDEGVKDAYGELSFFGLQTGTAVHPQQSTRHFSLSVGLIDTLNVRQQQIPESWFIGAHMSITSMTSLEVGSAWITADDVDGGLNDASNMLEITNISYKSATGGSHGWLSWCEVQLLWQRDFWPNDADVLDSGSDPYPVTIYADLMSLIEIGKLSGFEKRATFNGALTKKNAAAWDEILAVFACGRAVPVKIGRLILPVWDRPREPVAMVGQANIKEGSFQLSYSNPDLAPNSIEMEILDAGRNWQGQTVLVDHPSLQGEAEFHQVRKEKIALFGVTSRSQAMREGIYRLNKYVLSKRSAEFEVGPDCVHLLPGDRVLVSHDVPDYGESGRLPVAMDVVNTHPGGYGIYASWNDQGGDCTISDRSLFVDLPHGTLAPPLINYKEGGVITAYAVPTVNTGATGQVLGGIARSDGRERTPTWVAQYVARGSGLYPTPDWSAEDGPVSPLDIIEHLEKKINFSFYIKQPTGYCGSSASFALILYRLCRNNGYVNAAHGAYFTWNGSGAPVFGAYIGDNTGTSTPYGISYDISGAIAGGWYRVAITYDNDDTGVKTGAGSAAIGDYLQLRCFYNYPTAAYGSTLPQFIDIKYGGRGNQWLFGGDPTNLDSVDPTTGAKWVGPYVDPAAPGPGAQIIHAPTIAPPFYPQDTTAGTGAAGDRGFVVLYEHHTGTTSNPVMMTQFVDINFLARWPDSTSPLITSFANQPVCFTGYFRRYTAGESCAIRVNIRKGYTLSPTDLLTDAGGQVDLVYNGSIPSPAWTVTPATVGVGITINATVANVRLSDSTTDPDWVQLNIDVTSSGTFSQLAFQVGEISSLGTLYQRFYGWGYRLHGGSDIAGSLLVNPYPHQGTLLWGAMYEPDYTGGGVPTTFHEGGRVQLDRDVIATAGKNYEIAVRSSFDVDPNLNTDAIEILNVSSSVVPSVGSFTKGARTWLDISLPTKMYPRGGDIYSWGERGTATEDFVITDVSTDPETMVRKINCVEYDEAVYDDTTIAIFEGDGGDGALDGPDDWDGGSQHDITFGGVGFTDIRPDARVGNFRTNDGITVPSILLRWHSTTPLNKRKMPYKEMRIYVTALALADTSSKDTTYQIVASVPSGVNSYKYESLSLQKGLSYKFIFQPVGPDGSARILSACPSTVVRGSDFATPMITAPSVSATLNGFLQNYQVSKNTESDLKAVEGRIGGWIVSTPAWIIDPNTDRFDSRSILPVPTNSAGDTQAVVYARNKLPNGRYGVASSFTGSKLLVDVKASRQLIAENDWAAASDGSIDANLDVTSDVLHWDAASSSLGAIYYKMDELDAGSPRRSIVNGIIQGYQIRHERLGELKFTLGGDTGSNWSLEGPMQDDDGNASVLIEWRWTSGASLTGAWTTFEPVEIYARKIQFRLKWTRKNTADDVRLTRFTVQANDVPATTEVDGGTF